MIREEDLRDAIAECQGERNPNAHTCIKLAAYYTILNQLHPEPEQPTYSYAPSEEIMYNSGSEFAKIINGKSPDAVFKVLDELMETVQMLFPKLYYATLDKLQEI